MTVPKIRTQQERAAERQRLLTERMQAKLELRIRQQQAIYRAKRAQAQTGRAGR